MSTVQPPEIPLVRLPDLPEFDGLVAFGGNLSTEQILISYREGIFPCYYSNQPILWWSPDPRLILRPQELQVSRSLRRVIQQGCFQVRFDTNFQEVLRGCAAPRPKQQPETWLIPEMQESYFQLHQLGYAHSVECWQGEELVGGLYGIILGRIFFGESMFSRRSNASKVALVALVELLKQKNVHIIDCQMTSNHLQSMGAREIPRSEFMQRLKEALEFPTERQSWKEMGNLTQTHRLAPDAI